MEIIQSYKLRPGYGSKELLIEITKFQNINEVIKDILLAFDQLNFEADGEDLLLGDQLMYFKSSNGVITLNIDTWDCVFILGDKNQNDILKIDTYLQSSQKFKKEQVDLKDYI